MSNWINRQNPRKSVKIPPVEKAGDSGTDNLVLMSAHVKNDPAVTFEIFPICISRAALQNHLRARGARHVERYLYAFHLKYYKTF